MAQYKIVNREEINNFIWACCNETPRHTCISIKGDAPADMTYDTEPEEPVTSINVAWECPETKERVDIIYERV